MRLHHAGFLQGSLYVRNVVVQPGPLSAPPAARSRHCPSYRIIDFGRAEHREALLAGTEGASEEARRKQRRQWSEWVADEEARAQRELVIPDWDF